MGTGPAEPVGIMASGVPYSFTPTIYINVYEKRKKKGKKEKKKKNGKNSKDKRQAYKTTEQTSKGKE